MLRLQRKSREHNITTRKKHGYCLSFYYTNILVTRLVVQVPVSPLRICIHRGADTIAELNEPTTADIRRPYKYDIIIK